MVCYLFLIKGGEKMVTYMLMMKLTDAGIKDLKNSPKRVEEGIKAFEKIGGKLIGFYAAVGEYDFISIGEAPSDEAAIGFAFGLTALGYVKTTSVKLIPVKVYTELIKKLP
jgi:uncharacterized protein with GYD domain